MGYEKDGTGVFMCAGKKYLKNGQLLANTPMSTLKLYHNTRNDEIHWCISKDEAGLMFSCSRRQTRNYVFWNREKEREVLESCTYGKEPRKCTVVLASHTRGSE